MADALVFSRNRPLQLDACLRSLAANAPQICNTFVVYKATTDFYENGYRVLDDEHPDVQLIRETVFEEAVRDTLAGCSPHVLMLCDDAITYRPLPADPAAGLRDDVLCVSLRLGRNTVYCYPHDLEQSLPRFSRRGPFLTWVWHESTGDFGYPYSVDGIIHRRDDLLAWMEADVGNPNQLEDRVVDAIRQRADPLPRMACFPLSVQVGLPLNVVNTTHNNRVGMTHPQDPDLLNRRYLRGERVNWQAIDYHGIRGVHQELELVF